LIQTQVSRLSSDHMALDASCERDSGVAHLLQTLLAVPHLGTNSTKADAQVNAVAYRDPTKTVGLFAASMVAMCLGVCLIYSPLGVWSILRINIYLISLSTIKMTVKTVLHVYLFNFPVFLTMTHLLASSMLAFGVVFVRSCSKGLPISTPSCRELLCSLLPLTLCLAWGLSMNNTALDYISLGFAEIISASTPMFTVPVAWMMGIDVSKWLLLPIAVIITGVCASTKGEVAFSAIGFVLALTCNLSRALKSVIQQKLMTDRDLKEKYDPLTLLAWQSLLGFAAVAVFSLASEGAAPYRRVFFPEPESWPERSSTHYLAMIGAIAVSCANAAILNAAQIYVVKDLGAVGNNIAAETKSVLVVMGGVAFFGEVLMPTQVFGFTLVLGGAYWYARTEMSLKEEQLKQPETLHEGATATAVMKSEG